MWTSLTAATTRSSFPTVATDLSRPIDRLPAPFIESPLDREHLDRQTFGDRALQAELLDLFARQAESIVAEIGVVDAPAGSASALHAADRLHLLCGSARAVGFWDVASEAMALERRLRDPLESGGSQALCEATALADSVAAASGACAAVLREDAP